MRKLIIIKEVMIERSNVSSVLIAMFCYIRNPATKYGGWQILIIVNCYSL